MTEPCPSLFSPNGPQCNLDEGHKWPAVKRDQRLQRLHMAAVDHDGEPIYFSWWEPVA